ncbi:MAG: hypothetical protein JAY98_03490 [Candidatus Thiodiazotropha lotti]|nr:hypothetical protein [Candidatus Thiodiazotropha lotti]MCW4182237.1 hypothetical protein [Candidatus Thiodiazotropha weberae]
MDSFEYMKDVLSRQSDVDLGKAVRDFYENHGIGFSAKAVNSGFKEHLIDEASDKQLGAWFRSSMDEKTCNGFDKFFHHIHHCFSRFSSPKYSPEDLGPLARTIQIMGARYWQAWGEMSAKQLEEEEVRLKIAARQKPKIWQKPAEIELWKKADLDATLHAFKLFLEEKEDKK